MQDHKQDLAVMLRRLRLDCGYSQKAVATGLGVERSTYSNYELGKVSPDLDTLRRLAQIYAVPLEAFLYPEEYRTIEAARQRPPKKNQFQPRAHRRVELAGKRAHCAAARWNHNSVKKHAAKQKAADSLPLFSMGAARDKMAALSPKTRPKKEY